MTMPPPACIVWPVNQRACSLTKNATTSATSDGSPSRLNGEALKDIDGGDYGYCHACGIEIGIRRLEARPTATQCIDCKTLAEIKEKQLGG